MPRRLQPAQARPPGLAQPQPKGVGLALGLHGRPGPRAGWHTHGHAPCPCHGQSRGLRTRKRALGCLARLAQTQGLFSSRMGCPGLLE